MGDISEKQYDDLNIPLLEKLKHYLNYELSTSILLLLVVLSPILNYVISIVLAVFIPFAVYALSKNRKYNWLKGLAVILMPFVILLFTPISGMKKMFFLYLTEVFVFIYFVALRISVIGWINDYRFHQLHVLEKKKKEAADFDFWYQFKDKE